MNEIMKTAFSFLVMIALGCSSVLAQSLQKQADDHHRESQESSEGIVLGKIQGSERGYAAAGLTGKDGKKPDQSTLFEIGSITKVFTGILLAETVREKKAAFDDAVTKFLPKEVNIQDDSPLHKITLESLSTHTSGLPRLPSNMEQGVDPTNPYAHYDEKRLYTYLEDISAADMGKSGERSYSNLGVGFLGHLLELIWGTPYPDLVEEKIFKPLGMTSTLVPTKFDKLPSEVKAKLATGHAAGEAVPHWELGVLLGAGAIVSSAEDMLTFAEAHWKPETPEGLAVSLREVANERTEEQGLGWMMRGGELNHDGGTGGFRSSFTINPQEKTGRIRLVNSAGENLEMESSGNFDGISGFWEGTLDAGAQKLRLVKYISSDGRVIQFSLDQGFASMEATKTSIDKGEFRFSFPVIGGVYRGKVEGKDQLVGTWTQTGDIPLTMTRSEGMPPVLEEGLAKMMEGNIGELSGYWSGYLGGKNGLFVYVRIEKIGEIVRATLHSPDQTPAPIGLGKVVRKDDDKISFDCPPVNGRFEGEILEDKKSMKGIWTQLVPMPLELKWSKDEPSRE